MTRSPCKVLERLKRASGAVPHWELMREIDPRPTTAQTVTLRVYICRLRAELGKDAIRTIRGKGYELTEEARAILAA